MSLLGFDAIGRWALGQLPSNSNFVLQAVLGSIALTGRSAAFATSELAAAASFQEAGISAGFSVTLSESPGSFAFAGNVVVVGFRQASLGASFVSTSSATNSTVRAVASSGAVLLSGRSIPFFATFASSPGAFAWTGGSAAYDRDHEAWVRRPFDTMSWQLEAMLPSPIWSGATAPAGVWTADVEPESAWMPASIGPEPWTTE